MFKPIYGNGTVSVLLGNGDGTLQKQSDYGVGGTPSNAVAVGDFNGDGALDLAVGATVVELSSGFVAILMGNGLGGFGGGTNVGTGYYEIGAATTADFNGDGKLDLAVTADDGESSPSVLLTFLGNGSGTFSLSSSQSLAPYPSDAVVAGDFNGDGILDLVASVFSNGNNYFALGNGNGTFQALQAFSGSGDSLAVGDFNRDGRLDLAAGSSYTPGVTILLQQLVPVAALSASSLTFDDQTVGTVSASQTVTLTNTGSATLSISGMAVTGDFQETNTCGQSVAPLASCTLTVSFKPKTQGTLSGTLTIADNAGGSPQ